MADLLRYEHVDIAYNGVKVVKNVSFPVKRGEILGIVGESGSGKSTLIKAAMGLLGDGGLVTRGDILYKGKNLPDLPKNEMRRMCGPELGMIFQDAGSSFCPIRTVGAQLLESMQAHVAVPKEEFRGKAVQMLEKLGLKDGERILGSYPFELSGGMQQRVGIAGAMLLNPEVLFALVRRTFGTAIILVSHNIGVIRAAADKVLVMKNGETVEYGEAEKVLTNPGEAYTKQLLAAVPHVRRA